MKEKITFNVFCDRFQQMNRNDNFTYEGKRALFEYLESYEEDTGQQVELDIIALCCEYSEYEDLDEYLQNYNTDINKEDFEEEEFKEEVFKEIQDKTTLIKINDEAFIIQAY